MAPPQEHRDLPLLLLNELALDRDLDLVANDPPAIHHHVECHAEVLAVDLALGAVADAVAHHWIMEFSVLHHSKRHWPGGALDGQIAGQCVAILSGCLDLCAFEGNRWVLVDFQKVRRPQVVVSLGVVGMDTCCLDGDVNR